MLTPSPSPSLPMLLECQRDPAYLGMRHTQRGTKDLKLKFLRSIVMAILDPYV